MKRYRSGEVRERLRVASLHLKDIISDQKAYEGIHFLTVVLLKAIHIYDSHWFFLKLHLFSAENNQTGFRFQ